MLRRFRELRGPRLTHHAAAVPAWRRARDRIEAAGRIAADEADPRCTEHAILWASDRIGQTKALDQLALVHGQDVGVRRAGSNKAWQRMANARAAPASALAP